MLEVRNQNSEFLVYDTEADEAIMLFTHREDADELIATLQIQELHTKLKQWSPSPDRARVTH